MLEWWSNGVLESWRDGVPEVRFIPVTSESVEHLAANSSAPSPLELEDRPILQGFRVVLF